jgi:hypothetical protein
MEIWGSEVILPVLAILGVVLMLGTLAFVSLKFAKSQLQDRNQALGLPEGSIRAVIALSLIVLFAILTVYLFSNISKPSLNKLEGLTAAQRDAFITDVPERIIGIAHEEATPGTAAGPALYTIFIESRNPAADDFAKQLLVLLGTLVTSISSFYFGAKAGAAGAAGSSSDTPAPVIRSISPSSRAADGTSTDFQIQGDNLGLVKEVKIVSGSSQVLAGEVMSNDSLITGKFVVDSSAPAGTWNVIITDSGGQTSTLENGLTITTA